MQPFRSSNIDNRQAAARRHYKFIIENLNIALANLLNNIIRGVGRIFLLGGGDLIPKISCKSVFVTVLPAFSSQTDLRNRRRGGGGGQ